MTDIDISVGIYDAYVSKYRLFLFGNKSAQIQLPHDILEMIFEKFIYDGIGKKISLIHCLSYYPKIGLKYIDDYIDEYINGKIKTKSDILNDLIYDADLMSYNRYCTGERYYINFYTICYMIALCTDKQANYLFTIKAQSSNIIIDSLYLYIYHISISDGIIDKKIIIPSARLHNILSCYITNGTRLRRFGSVLPLLVFQGLEKIYAIDNVDEPFIQNSLSNDETVKYISSKYPIKQYNTYINIIYPDVSLHMDNGYLPSRCMYRGIVTGTQKLLCAVTDDDIFVREKHIDNDWYALKMLISYIDKLDTIKFHNKKLTLNNICGGDIYYNRKNIRRIIDMRITGITIRTGYYCQLLTNKPLSETQQAILIKKGTLFELAICAPNLIKDSLHWNINSHSNIIVDEYIYTLRRITIKKYEKLLRYIPDSMMRILYKIHNKERCYGSYLNETELLSLNRYKEVLQKNIHIK